MPEALFDEDNPGHYTRRLKSVSLTVAVGERLVDAIRCTLAILRGSVRTSASTAGAMRAPARRTRVSKTARPRIRLMRSRCGGNLLKLDYTPWIFQPFDGPGPRRR